jgi:tetratricopeptide (TPR) repeat protein
MRARWLGTILIACVGCGAAAAEEPAVIDAAPDQATAPTASPSVSPRRVARMKHANTAPYPPPDPDAKPSRADMEQARREFSDGVRAFENGQFQEAVRDFEKAYALVPNAKVLHNIGMALLESGEIDRACATLELYARYGDDVRTAALPTTQCPNLETLPAP